MKKHRPFWDGAFIVGGKYKPMKRTTNYNLIKPELNDPADITATNINWDILDTELMKRTPNEVVVATSSDGISYTATADWVTELYNGLEITVIPSMSSVQPNITLNVNSLGRKQVRMTLPVNSNNAGVLATENGWFSENAPMTLRYHAETDTWKSDLQCQSAQSLYGQVPVQKGGWVSDSSTTEEDITEALTALKAMGLQSQITFGTDAPSGGSSGDVYIQIIE